MKKQNINHILEQVRKKGRNGDTILAHINPIEAVMLKKAGGSGTINPKTGLPEFGFFNKPKKWLKGSIGGMGGAILGNMLLPGLGGIIGGGIGAAAGSKVRGRKDAGSAALRGLAMGAMLPSVASAGGWLANSVGEKGLGAKLADYGDTNSILSAIGLGNKSSAALKGVEGGAGASAIMSAMGSKGKKLSKDDLENYHEYLEENGIGGDSGELGYFDKLKKNSANFITKPKNLLALGSTGLSLYDRMNQPKPLTAAQRGKAAKEEMIAARLTAKELAEQEEYELALEQSKRRNARKKFLPEERIDITPLYNRVSSPEEYGQTKRWLNYYDNPRFTGPQIRF